MPEAAERMPRRRVPNTKITVPDLPAHMVSRPRLLPVLDRAGDVPVTTVCAPAGSGKTLFLAEWAHRRNGPGVCWVSLDADDNDGRRLWSALLDALETHPPIGSAGRLAAIEVPTGPSEIPAFLAEVDDALVGEPVVLVLDGIHELSDPVVLNGLQSFVRYQPPGLRLILSSRLDPPLSLARLRLADQLFEIKAGQLRFTEADAEALFALAGAEVPPETLTRLVEETEGWAVGLRIAVDAVVREGGAEEVLAGHDKVLRRYLDDELLSTLDSELREFLFAIAVAGSVSVELAIALSCRKDAAAALDELRDRTMILTREESGEYRLPSLLRSCLLADLGRRNPDTLTALHSRASEWFLARDLPAPALEHAVKAGDPARLRRILRASAVRLFVEGAHRILRRALSTLDDNTLAKDPLLTLVLAALHLELAETGTAGLHLTRAEANWPPEASAELTAMRAFVLSRLAQIGGEPDAGAADRGMAGEPALRLLAVAQRAAVTQEDGARERLEVTLAEAGSSGQDYVALRCLTSLARIAEREADYRAMDRIAHAVETRTRHEGGTVERVAGSVLLAYTALLSADPAEAVSRAGDAEQDTKRWPSGGNAALPLAAAVLRGAAVFELGDWYEGLRRLGEARSAMTGRALPPECVALCAVLEHRAALLLGAGELARAVLRWSQRERVEEGELLLMTAAARLALGKPKLAARSLDPLLTGKVPTALGWSRIEGTLVGARAALAQGERDREQRLLERALALSEETGTWFPLVFAPSEVIDTLTALLGRPGDAGRVLDRRRRINRPPLPTALTDRERSVLRLLPTLRSIEEIAADLTVSPNTVKTHVRGIYAKLAVSKRRDAVAVAIRQGLLSPRSDGTLD
ncbi:hypothetical protein BAY61_10105 [Prauserella marina]|uniref:LuxR family transcriptional regulator, maltose regulon positive regulatory protein n=1 Tax=Prauserella marina TaxID=530584 RepID=A0A222VN03_9PSEU|nr:LuxR C-terminal-related transcriptional regulator [Prauserella marina]ASR35289.1 hypothetical protein BAY61_10105 [Prauserella marina]PWV84934.1 LuxR family maltose regulon positive regulatory protein [Prauserella marina]SDC09004.1 LuxR family transcriptional regulator, maltose regulon positive regulatory protein [Prauserella marina]